MNYEAFHTILPICEKGCIFSLSPAMHKLNFHSDDWWKSKFQKSKPWQGPFCTIKLRGKRPYFFCPEQHYQLNINVLGNILMAHVCRAGGRINFNYVAQFMYVCVWAYYECGLVVKHYVFPLIVLINH